ncbi:DUF3035 domain-containing protein [Candidatus Pelagibacter sp.]|mgnify:FL=1|nr:DUF3035 domain-containing protein [Candidatus Pelagibacter sp.]
MKKILLNFIILSFLIGCNSVKEGLTLQKKDNADEFLVKKKNPLVLPPEFNKLPTPDDTTQKKEDDSFNNIKDLINKNDTQISNSKNTKKIEQNILEKIKNK